MRCNGTVSLQAITQYVTRLPKGDHSMRFILLALFACGLAGGAQAAPDRGRGVSQPGPTRVAAAPAAASTRAAIARQATNRRPSAQPVQRSTANRRAAAQPLSRNLRGANSRGARQPGYAASRGGRQAAASCPRGSRAAHCRGERRFAWQSGLPQAAGVQTVSCPTGTVETPAHGHTTIMRCLPL